jgi:hypothetical protein
LERDCVDFVRSSREFHYCWFKENQSCLLFSVLFAVFPESYLRLFAGFGPKIPHLKRPRDELQAQSWKKPLSVKNMRQESYIFSSVYIYS